jgi:hypothetical protein
MAAADLAAESSRAGSTGRRPSPRSAYAHLCRTIERLREAAREEERELCARLAETYAPGCMGGTPIAAAIRRLRTGGAHDPLESLQGADRG